MRHLLWLIVIILILVIIWNPWGRKNDESDLWTTEFSNMKADLMLEGISYQRHTGKNATWVINAEQARFFESEQKMMFDKPDIRFFGAGDGKVEICAASGEYVMSDEMVILQGNVKAATDDNTVLLSDFLRLRQKDMKIDTNQPIKIYRADGLSINGTGMKYDINNGSLTINSVTAIVPATSSNY